MNTNDIEANWNQLKGNLRATFGKLTDDDMLEIEGKAEALTGKLQERYNLSSEEVEKVVTGMRMDESGNLQLTTSIQGEGDYEASRRFQEAQHEFADKHTDED